MPDLPTTASAQRHPGPLRQAPFRWYRRRKVLGDDAGFEDWLAGQAPYPGYGCRVQVCPELANSPLGLCARHESRYRSQGSPGEAALPTGAQIGIQAPHARQPPGDRPGRQAGLAILQPHYPLAMPGSALSHQEREHVRSRDLRWGLGHHREEDLQIGGHGKPRVGPGPGGHELQIVIQQGMPEPDHLDAVACCRADQAWHEFQRVVSFRPDDTPRQATMSLPLDHPHIKQASKRMAGHFVYVTQSGLENVLQHVWVAGPGSASPGALLTGDAAPLTREHAQALAIDLSRRSTSGHPDAAGTGPGQLGAGAHRRGPLPAAPLHRTRLSTHPAVTHCA